MTSPGVYDNDENHFLPSVDVDFVESSRTDWSYENVVASSGEAKGGGAAFFASGRRGSSYLESLHARWPENSRSSAFARRLNRRDIIYGASDAVATGPRVLRSS